MHQCVVQWLDNDDIKVVQADNLVTVAAIDPTYWDFDNVECFSRKEFLGDFLLINDGSQQPIQTVGFESNF